MSTDSREQDHQRWLDVVIFAFERSGERPSLQAIYKEVRNLIRGSQLDTNKAPEATIRDLLQRHCLKYRKKFVGNSLFLNPRRGVWLLDQVAVQKRKQDRQEAEAWLKSLVEG